MLFLFFLRRITEYCKVKQKPALITFNSQLTTALKPNILCWYKQSLLNNVVQLCVLFCSRGLLDPVLALNLSTYLIGEQHPVPWSVARHVSKCLTGVFTKPNKLLYKVHTTVYYGALKDTN